MSLSIESPSNSEHGNVNKMFESMWNEVCSSSESVAVASQTAAHCGMYDLTCENFKKMKSLGSDAIQAWVKVQHPDAVTSYILDSSEVLGWAGTLHINFPSEADLVKAMEESTSVNVVERLVRCCTRNMKSCGMPVTAFPENVILVVQRKSVVGVKAIEVAKVRSLLESVCGKNVLIDRMSSVNPKFVNVRFHKMCDVEMLVSKESELVLDGHKVLVEVPNVPSLVRCNECGGRGHKRDKCPKLQSLVVRLLFQKPVCEAFRQELLKHVKCCEAVYVGMKTNGTAPNPMVHFVFATNEDMLTTVPELMKVYRGLLMNAPKKVNLSEVHHECNWCGQLVIVGINVQCQQQVSRKVQMGQMQKE